MRGVCPSKWHRISTGGGARILTLFTTAKPFDGHSAVIQRNALASWTRLHADVEVILFGDDAGAAQIARELGLRHEPHVERNRFGSKRLDYMFARAREIARYDVLCYCNCDILLLPEFCEALGKVREGHARFLMVGRRWDTEVREALDFSDAAWGTRAKELARKQGVQQPAWSIDYFAFRRGLYAEMPALVIGRVWWDHWLVWKARAEGAAVVDASEVVMAIHQNHDYGYHPLGARGVWTDEQAMENYELAGGQWHLLTMDDATFVLGADGERANWKRLWAPYWRYARPKVAPAWYALLDSTRPVRTLLGLRSTRRGRGAKKSYGEAAGPQVPGSTT
jgi:hypothetical protein